jgi:hypothetical protein
MLGMKTTHGALCSYLLKTSQKVLLAYSPLSLPPALSSYTKKISVGLLPCGPPSWITSKFVQSLFQVPGKSQWLGQLNREFPTFLEEISSFPNPLAVTSAGQCFLWNEAPV